MSVDSGWMGDVAPLRVTLEARTPGVVVASVEGVLDRASTSYLDRELSAAIAAGPCRSLVLDLAGVSTLDSTGLRALWTIRQTMREVGASFALRRPSAVVIRVLEAAGLTAEFDVV